jgi:protein TonB
MHGPLWELTRKIENFWWGAVRVDSVEQQKRLLQAPAPEYPEAARRAGIEGQVTMLVRIGADGAVQDATLLYGEPILGRAAAHAIEQWRYAPLRIGGEPVNVLTAVTLAFELR